MSLRSARGVANRPRRLEAPGFEVAFLRPELIGGGMDPFLQIDAFALAEPVFKPHPHAGFNAVTYLLPESPQGFINRDSLGTRRRIAPGALHWTTAGSGIIHEEVPEVRGIAVLGLQVFINLPAARKHMAPGFLHLEPEAVPVVSRDGATIRVVSGESNGAVSPLVTPTPGVRLVDVTLQPRAVFEQELTADENAFAWLFNGSATIAAGSGGEVLRTFDLVGFELDGTRVRLQAGAAGARLVLCAGPPLGEPIAASGPFVMSTPEELERAYADYASGRLGQLSASAYRSDGGVAQ